MTVKLEEKEVYAKIMESAKRIGQIAEKEALQADENRTLSKNVIDAIVEEGINRLIMPKEYGHPQIDFTTFTDMVKTVGYYNLSAAWLTYFYSLHNSWVAFLPKNRMDEIYNDGGLIADIFAPVGKVERCEGGYRLSGQWKYVSGINNATWLSVGAWYQFEGEEMPHQLLLTAKVTEFTVIKDWDSLGLRGSGSNTVIAEDLFIPEDMVLNFTKINQNRKPDQFEVDEDFLYYHVPYYSAFFIGFAAMSIGAAERVIDEFKERTSKRVRIFGQLESESANAQRVLAQLTLKQKASVGLMKEYINMIETDNGQYHPSEYHAIRASIIQNCIDISVRATLAMGASAILKGSPFEMITRDLITIGTHITSLYDDAVDAYGKTLFGIEAMSLG